MISINPSQSLNTYAKGMVKSIVNNSPEKKVYINKFLKEANTTGTQGNAIVAYFTEYNNMLAKKQNFVPKASERVKKLPELIEKEINDAPVLQKEAKKFIQALTESYPKTLEKRISLASQGAVVSDRVEPKSKFKKFMVLLNKLIKPEE